MKSSIYFLIVIFLVAMLIACNSKEKTSLKEEVKKELVPGEQAPPAPEGSRGFGMPRPSNDTTPPVQRRRRASASVLDEREIGTMTLDELAMSDPFILPDPATQTYYMTSSGGAIWKSTDLKNWEGPYGSYDVNGTWMEGVTGVAAAELHHINGKYYYVATFRGEELVDVVPRRYNIYRQQSMILVSDQAAGPYKHINSDPEYDYLYHDWKILDGSLWHEDGITYFLFVHEWLQTVDGTMEYVILSDDLSERVSEPKCIFRASEAPWALEMVGNGEMTYGLALPGWVTDAPQVFRTGTGRLGMLWSSWGANRYAQGVAWSESGSMEGPWIQQEEPLKGDNSGHGMMFTTFEGKRLLVIHHAEGDGPRKPQLWEIDDSGDELVLGARYNP